MTSMPVTPPSRPRRRRDVLAVIGLASALALVGGACGGDGTGSGGGEGPVILVTTSIWADVVSAVACDPETTVETLVPIGADPHTYEPSLADRGALEDAALVVANGLGLEAGLDDTLSAVEEAGTPVFRLADHVDTLAVSTAAARDEGSGDDGHDHEGDNPHIWFDPTRVSIAVGPLADELVEVGVDRDAVGRCLADHRQELAELDARVEEILAPIDPQDRLLVTNHDSLVYFADRYDFEVIGTIIPAASTLAETNPAQLEELAQLVDDLDVPAVFAEAQTSTADAEALADRVGGVEVVTLHTGTLAGPGSGAESYAQLMVTDAELIAAALAGGAG